MQVVLLIAHIYHYTIEPNLLRDFKRTYIASFAKAPIAGADAEFPFLFLYQEYPNS